MVSIIDLESSLNITIASSICKQIRQIHLLISLNYNYSLTYLIISIEVGLVDSKDITHLDDPSTYFSHRYYNPVHALLYPSDSFSSFELTEHLISPKLSPLYLSLDLFLP